MAQYVPRLEWSERALKAREFIFDFWAEHGRGPNLRQAHEGTGMSRRDLVSRVLHITGSAAAAATVLTALGVKAGAAAVYTLRIPRSYASHAIRSVLRAATSSNG